MAKVEFIFNDIRTLIQCNEDAKINDIFNKYAIKIKKNINDIYIVYDQYTNKIDKEKKN